MHLELDDEEAAALGLALDSRLRELTFELARAERHDLQHELALMVTRLELVAARLDGLRMHAPSPVVDASPR